MYQYKDHLGNVRLSYADCDGNGTINPATEILEENNYYPFGLQHQGYNDIANSCRNEEAEAYKLNGKEYEDSFGLNIYEMDMRQYDPALGRWVVQDPVTHHDYSPYSAFDNNPVYWSDPSGADSHRQLTRMFSAQGDQAVQYLFALIVAAGDLDDGADQIAQVYGHDTYEEWISTSGKTANNPADENADGSKQDGKGKSKNSNKPVYHYNGKKYSDGAELYVAILLDTAAEQFGITDIIALGTAIDGLGFVDKPFQMKGASKGTSLLSKGLSSQFPQKMPWRLPTLSNNLTLKFTNVLGRFMGRTIPIIGWGVLTYDVGMTLYRTQVIYNNITN